MEVVFALNILLCPAPRVGALSDDARLTSVAYIRPNSITERLGKTKIGTEVAHVTCDSDTTFTVRNLSNVNLFDGKKGITCAHILLHFALL